jgi:hypothetical protein
MIWIRECFSNVAYYFTYFFRVTCIALVGLSKNSPWIFGNLHLRPNPHLVYELRNVGMSLLNNGTKSVSLFSGCILNTVSSFRIRSHTKMSADIPLVEGFTITEIVSHRTVTKFSFSTFSDVCYGKRLEVKLSLGLIEYHPINTHGTMVANSIHSQPRNCKLASCHLKSLNVEIRVYVGHGLTVRALFEALNFSVFASNVSVSLYLFSEQEY